MDSDQQTCVLLDSPQIAKQWLTPLHAKNRRVGYVPTMGALHDGHLSLIRKAASQCDIVCASIFVNPLQFNNPEDLEKYPRDIDTDVDLLQENGCHMVFTGILENFFPETHDGSTIKNENPGFYANSLEGEFRPGHFSGVRTIVRRLFETVGQCQAYFGEKDFQQTLVVKQLAAEIGNVQIVVCPTLREANGLAMSSRNERLTKQQRNLAGTIYQSMVAAIRAWDEGERNAQTLTQMVSNKLSHEQITVEYAELRDPDNWSAEPLSGDLTFAPQLLIAVQIGDVRLIDNTNLANIELIKHCI